MWTTDSERCAFHERRKTERGTCGSDGFSCVLIVPDADTQTRLFRALESCCTSFILTNHASSSTLNHNTNNKIISCNNSASPSTVTLIAESSASTSSLSTLQHHDIIACIHTQTTPLVSAALAAKLSNLTSTTTHTRVLHISIITTTTTHTPTHNRGANGTSPTTP